WEEMVGGSRRLSFYVSGPSTRTINVWMREDGVEFDKLVVTRDARYVPSGLGPAQTVDNGTGGTGGSGGTGGTGGSTAGSGGSGGSGGTGGSTGGTAGSGGTGGSGGSTGGGACLRARRLW